MNTAEETAARVKSPVYILLSFVSSVLIGAGVVALVTADGKILSFLGAYEKFIYDNGAALLAAGFMFGAINFYIAFIRRPPKET